MSSSAIAAKLEELGGIEAVFGGDPNPVSDHLLAKVECVISASLPPGYKEFMKEFGPCRFRNPVIFRPETALPAHISSDGTGCLDYFFEVEGDGDAWNTLSWAIGAYKDRMPDSLIPIGGDIRGGVICLGIAGEEQDKVYYWDPANEWDEDDLEDGESFEELRFQNVHFVASSFLSFVSCLEESPSA